MCVCVCACNILLKTQFPFVVQHIVSNDIRLDCPSLHAVRGKRIKKYNFDEIDICGYTLNTVVDYKSSYKNTAPYVG